MNFNYNSDLLNLILSNINECIVALDRDCKIILINKYAIQILGYDNPDELIGKDWFDKCIPEDNRKNVKKVYNKIINLELNNTEFFENEILCKNNNKKIILWHNSLLKDENQNIIGTLSSGEDISDRKKLEFERENLLIKIAKSKNEIEEFVYTIGHDLKSPLVNIQGFSNELKSSINTLIELINLLNCDKESKKKILDFINNDLNESLDFINLSSIKMGSLIKGLLTVSKIDFFNLNIQKIKMNLLIDNVIKLFEYKIKEKDIELKIGTLPDCMGDENLINQVFSNLVGNAVKYLDVNKKGQISISGYIENNYSVYIIEDNGVGIPDYAKDRIFHLFYRVNPKSDDGEGLGLSIVNKIVNIHNGSITFESELGKGTKFIIKLINI